MKTIVSWCRVPGSVRLLAVPLLVGLLTFTACSTDTPEAAAPAVPATPAPATATPEPPTPLPTPDPTPVDQEPTPADEALAVPGPTIAVSSSDGNTRLLIPESALPDGFDSATITFTSAPVADYSHAFPEGGPDFAVRLEPDGLQFAQPITIEIVVESTGDGVPILWQLSDDGLEMVSNTSTVADPGTGLLTISGEISHFSSVIGDLDGFFSVNMPSPGDHLLGDTFTVTTTITRTGVSPQASDGPVSFISRTFDPWTLSGLFSHVGPAAVPSRVPDLPPRTAVGSPTYTVTSDFSCAKVGNATFNYVANIVYFVESAILDEEEQVWKKSDFGHYSTHYVSFFMDCLAPTPTPTETPTIVPTPEGSQEIEVLHHANERFPLEQFKVADPDVCEKDHYHASFTVHSLEGGTAHDPKPSGCGFGEVGTPGLVTTVRVTAEEWAAYRTALAGP